MFPLQANVLPRDPMEDTADRSLRLCFSVTWSLLSTPYGAAKAQEPASSRKAPLRTTSVPTNLEPPPIISGPSVPDFPASPKASEQWEMVIPKMSRPVADIPPAALPSRSARSTMPVVKAPSIVASSETFVLGSKRWAPTESEVSPPHSAEPSAPDLGLGTLLRPSESFWSRLPATLRIGIAAVASTAIISGIFLLSGDASSGPRDAVPAPPSQPTVVEAGPALSTDTRWIADWFADGPKFRPLRHVDVLDGSLTMSDYRVEFQGQIDHGAIGWVFRANGRGNFYVEKVAVISQGPKPDLALVRFAVVDGKEQPRTQLPLPIRASLETMYRIRMDAVGSQFSTWLQDQKVDQWTDDQIKSGGVGLYYDRGDSARLRGSMRVIPLKVKR